MTTSTVLVLGATGKTGRRVAPRLRLAGFGVRVASRSSATRFDWSDRATWCTALADVDAVWIVAPSDPEPIADFVTEIERSGVRQAVLLSGYHADQWGDSGFGDDMIAAEQAVRGSSLDWTVLRASNFFEDLDEEVFHAPLVAGELATPADHVPEPFIAIDDVADVAVAAFLDPAAHAGRIHELTGPRSWRFDEVTNLIGTVTGRDIGYVSVDADEFVRRLRADGVDEPGARVVSAMFAMMATGVNARTTDTVERVLGRPATRLEDWVVRIAATGAWDARHDR